MIKRVISFDPGGTTGVAALVLDTFTQPEIPTGDVSKWMDTTVGWHVDHIGPESHHVPLWFLLEQFRPTSVVCESFEFRQGKQRAGIVLDSKEYIGVIKLWCALNKVPLIMQTAATGKGFVTDEKIKALDLWVPGKKHAMDAMRHLITYLVQKERRMELARPWKDL
jgi:hypothetical protein